MGWRGGWELTIVGPGQIFPGFGFLQRRAVLRWVAGVPASKEAEAVAEHLEEVEEDDDPSTLSSSPRDHQGEHCLVNFSICLSPTFQVPVLFFTAHRTCKHFFSQLRHETARVDFPRAAGAPLPLADLLRSTIFHSSRSNSRTYPFSTLLTSSTPNDPADLDAPAPPPPFLSQADHPTLGTPSWFLHPCETEAIMSEVLASGDTGSGGALDPGWRGDWLESWLMVVGSVVDLRE
jgi:ubiquitin-like-conjugating enzyme ATG10